MAIARISFDRTIQYLGSRDIPAGTATEKSSDAIVCLVAGQQLLPRALQTLHTLHVHGPDGRATKNSEGGLCYGRVVHVNMAMNKPAVLNMIKHLLILLVFTRANGLPAEPALQGY